MADYTTDEQTAISELGQINKNRFDAVTNPKGLAGIGYKTLIALIANYTAAVSNAIKRQADAAKAAADTAVSVAINAPVTTSATSIAIASSGTVTFACSTNLQTVSPFRPGMWVKAVDAANPNTKWVWGQVPASGVSGNNLSLVLSKSAGSGSVSNWYIQATGPDGPASGIASVQADTSPELGGDLNTSGSDIVVGTGDAIKFASGSLGLDLAGMPIEGAVLGASNERIVSLGTVSNNVTINPTTSKAEHFKMKLGGNATIVLPTTLTASTIKGIQLQIKQAATGGPYTVTWPSSVKFLGSAPVMSTTASSTDIYILRASLDDTTPTPLVVYAAVPYGQGWVGL